MIVAADDVGDAHIMIVDHHRQHVGRGAVRPQQHEIVELGIGDRDPALDEILDHGLALAWGLEANHEGHVFGGSSGIAIAPFALDPERPALGLGFFAPRGQLFGGEIAAIGRAALDQLVRNFRVARLELRLEIGLAVTADPEPVEPVEDGVHRRLRSSGRGRYPRSARDICRHGGGRTAS